MKTEQEEIHLPAIRVRFALAYAQHHDDERRDVVSTLHSTDESRAPAPTAYMPPPYIRHDAKSPTTRQQRAATRRIGAGTSCHRKSRRNRTRAFASQRVESTPREYRPGSCRLVREHGPSLTEADTSQDKRRPRPQRGCLCIGIGGVRDTRPSTAMSGYATLQGRLKGHGEESRQPRLASASPTNAATQE